VCPPPGSKLTRASIQLRIYRRVPGQPQSENNPGPDRRLRKSVKWILPDCSQPQFLDQTFDGKHYEYFATVVTVVSNPGSRKLKLKGRTPVVQVFAHDIFRRQCLAACRRFLQRRTGALCRPGVVPDTEADLAGYNIFRREEGNPAREN